MKIFQYWKIWNCNSIQIKNFEFASSTVKMQNKRDINNKIKKILKVLYKKIYDDSFLLIVTKSTKSELRVFFLHSYLSIQEEGEKKSQNR